jgi:methylphosphotriester-DNA--protein-cysteine methyltransferase
VVARKVITATSAAYWLRADLADAAVLRIAEAEEEVQRILADVIGWSAAQDEANAARRGMTVDEYRRERNAQGHRQYMKSGRNSIGIR